MARKKKQLPPGVLITGVVLFLLIILTIFRLIKDTKTVSDETSANSTPLEEHIEASPSETPDGSEESNTDDTAVSENTILTPEEQLAAFLPDYESAPLLSTTSIRDLSLEIGASSDELRFNWLSPSVSAGMIKWTNSSGEMQTFEARTSASATVSGYYVNKASVTGINASASYTYQVGNDDGWSPVYSYHAPTDNPDKLTFLVTADAQIGQSDMEDASVTAERWDSVLNRIISYVPDANFLFHLGDQVADFGSEEHYRLYLEHLPLYRIALAPVVGNHDVPNDYSLEENGHPGSQYFYEHFNVPNRSSLGQSQYDQDGDYYFIRNNVLFLVLNSNTSQGETVHEQFAAQVTAEHPDVRWKILVQHYSPYSAQDSHTNTKEYLARIAADNDIDLVLSAHDHIYSRAAFMNRDCESYNDYDYEPGSTVVNPEGTLYVTCGTSSGCLYHEPDPDIRKKSIFRLPCDLISLNRSCIFRLTGWTTGRYVMNIRFEKINVFVLLILCKPACRSLGSACRFALFSIFLLLFLRILSSPVFHKARAHLIHQPLPEYPAEAQSSFFRKSGYSSRYPAHNSGLQWW